jgi:predicted flap endonuclease-1-like 5' DNA nuclease
MSKPKKPTSDLPAGLSQPAIRALHSAGITRLAQLAKASEAELLELHGMGPKGIRTIREALKARGMKRSS